MRTDPTAPKHRGISYLLVNMKSPGITVRPLRQISGESEFNEVFFEDVRVPRENLVGRLNDGWRVAMTTLSNERGTMAFALAARYENHLQRGRELVPAMGGATARNPMARQQVAQFYIDLQALKFSLYRNFSKILREGTPGPRGIDFQALVVRVGPADGGVCDAVDGAGRQLVEDSPHAIDSGRWPLGLLRSRCRNYRGGNLRDPSQHHRRSACWDCPRALMVDRHQSRAVNGCERVNLTPPRGGV